MESNCSSLQIVFIFTQESLFRFFSHLVSFHSSKLQTKMLLNVSYKMLQNVVFAATLNIYLQSIYQKFNLPLSISTFTNNSSFKTLHIINSIKCIIIGTKLTIIRAMLGTVSSYTFKTLLMKILRTSFLIITINA